MPSRLTQEGFIARAKEVWGDRFDLSAIVYKNSNSKIDVRCLKHGMFAPLACNFLAGHSCPQCGRERTVAAKRKDTEYFIEKAREIHGDKYDYSRTCYENNRKKVEIICPVHGSFFQKPNDHLLGKGCIRCAGINALNSEEFIEKARKVHGDKYDYSLVSYKGNKTRVKIICPVHGVFEQIPNSHLTGRGCPVCKSSTGEQAVEHFLAERNIGFEREKIFNGCRDKGCLRFDFYIPSLNTCIEFQGRQHYEIEPFFDRDGDSFQKRKHRDQIKRIFCRENKIGLLEIRYDEDVETKLKEVI